MTVNPGFGGQKLIPATLEKLARLRQRTQQMGWQGELEVDGGINATTAARAAQAGRRCFGCRRRSVRHRVTLRDAMIHLRQALAA